MVIPLRTYVHFNSGSLEPFYINDKFELLCNYNQIFTPGLKHTLKVFDSHTKHILIVDENITSDREKLVYSDITKTSTREAGCNAIKYFSCRISETEARINRNRITKGKITSWT